MSSICLLFYLEQCNYNALNVAIVITLHLVVLYCITHDATHRAFWVFSLYSLSYNTKKRQCNYKTDSGRGWGLQSLIGDFVKSPSPLTMKSRQLEFSPHNNYLDFRFTFFFEKEKSNKKENSNNQFLDCFEGLCLVFYQFRVLLSI